MVDWLDWLVRYWLWFFSGFVGYQSDILLKIGVAKEFVRLQNYVKLGILANIHCNSIYYFFNLKQNQQTNAGK